MAQYPIKTTQSKRSIAIEQLRRHIAEGHFGLAYTFGQSLLSKHKRDAEIHFLLGLIAEQTSQLKIARTHAHKSVTYSEHADSLFLLSRIERMDGNTDRSIDLCDRALKICPHSTQLFIHRAGTLEEAGRVEEARAVVEPLIDRLESSRSPIPVELKCELTKLLVQEKEYHNAVELIDEIVTDQSTPPQLKRLQLYLQAKAYDRAERYDQAFSAATQANTIEQLEFDPMLYEQQVTSLIEQWTAERIAKFPQSECDAELPVFIAGMPRSGTSLIDQIIDSHPHASGIGEVSTIEGFAHQLSIAYNAELNPPHCFGKHNRFRWTRVANDYVASAKKRSPKESIRVVNKALGNNKLVGLLACLFPKTRIIHAHRDPRDVAISCYMGGFNDRLHPWTTKLDWALTACEQSHRMMEHWKSVLNIPILDVQYENLVANPLMEIPRLIEFLELEWNDNCLSFHKSNRTVRTLSYDQVNKPLYTSSVGRYRHYQKQLGAIDIDSSDQIQ